MNQQILPCWLAGSQFLKIKFYWNTATLIYLHIVYGCFCITTAELSSYDRECMVCKAKNIYYLVLYRNTAGPWLILLQLAGFSAFSLPSGLYCVDGVTFPKTQF